MKHTFLVMTLFFSQFCHAADSINAQQHAEVKTFFNNYLDHFNTYLKDQQNSEAINLSAADIHMPAVMLPPGGQFNFIDNPESISKGTIAFLDRLLEAGVKRIDWKKVNIQVLNKHAALANNTAVLLKANNQVHQTISSTYILHQAPDSKTWQIVMRILNASPNQL